MRNLGAPAADVGLVALKANGTVHARSPDDKLGVATISAGVQRSGGSIQHPMSELDDALEAMAAYVEVCLPGGGAALPPVAILVVKAPRP